MLTIVTKRSTGLDFDFAEFEVLLKLTKSQWLQNYAIEYIYSMHMIMIHAYFETLKIIHIILQMHAGFSILSQAKFPDIFIKCISVLAFLTITIFISEY